MEYSLGNDPQYDSPFRLVEIDGELDQGGRLVCMNGTGDLPLFMYTIDSSQCVTEVPQVFITPASFTPAVPEPSTWALMCVMLVACIWRKHVR